MGDSLLDVLLPDGAAPSRVFGVVIGIVTNNDDPDGLGRVKVRFPWLSDDDESSWARMSVPMAGNGRGMYLLPEIDDEVLVAFEHGDVRFPYVLGALWNGQDAPPESKPLEDGKVSKRLIRSRSGHVIRLDDTDGKERIEVIDKTTENGIVIDASDNTITVHANGDITLQSSQGKVVIKGQAVEITSTAQGVKVQSAAGMDLEASGPSNVKGSVVNIN